MSSLAIVKKNPIVTPQSNSDVVNGPRRESTQWSFSGICARRGHFYGSSGVLRLAVSCPMGVYLGNKQIVVRSGRRIGEVYSLHAGLLERIHLSHSTLNLELMSDSFCMSSPIAASIITLNRGPVCTSDNR